MDADSGPDGVEAGDAVQKQLFRYAQDLNELLAQHLQLQRRFRTVSQSYGRGDLSNDILINAVRHNAEQFLMTDDLGRILEVSPAAKRFLPRARSDKRVEHLWEVCHPSAVFEVNSILGKFSEGQMPGAIEQRLCMLFDNCKGGPWNIWAIPASRYGRTEICWVFAGMDGASQARADTLQELIAPQSCAEGVMFTDAVGSIEYVNNSFSRITGYGPQEVLGRNPKMLSAKLHPHDFFDAFWIQLKESGSWTGELFNRRSNGQIYTEWKTVKAIRNATGATVSYLGVFADLSSQAWEREELSRLANHDALTGLPNRRLLDDRISQALAIAARANTGLYVMMLDLDKFKAINDKYGHATGDQVLKVVGARIKGCLRESDTVARVGGDEFVILLQNQADESNAESIASAFLNSLGAPIEVNGQLHSIKASIGCSRYPVDGRDPEELLRCADMAMFGAKRFGLEFSFYDSGESGSGARDLGFDLWRALDRGQMSVVYQPLTAADNTCEIKGCEVLVRWQHPELGEVEPALFVPIAEKNGAILPLGDWVLRTAGQQLREWELAGISELSVTVHVSARQLLDPDFPARVRQVLDETAVPAVRVVLGIREADAVRCLVDSPLLQASLRSLGVRLALVDFSADNIGLTQLRSLRFDSIRINRDLVQRLSTCQDAAALSQCFIGIGDALGLAVTASGVEAPEQLQALLDQGCNLVQGYLIAKPMPAPEFKAWVLAQRSQGN